MLACILVTDAIYVAAAMGGQSAEHFPAVRPANERRGKATFFCVSRRSGAQRRIHPGHVRLHADLEYPKVVGLMPQEMRRVCHITVA